MIARKCICILCRRYRTLLSRVHPPRAHSRGRKPVAESGGAWRSGRGRAQGAGGCGGGGSVAGGVLGGRVRAGRTEAGAAPPAPALPPGRGEGLSEAASARGHGSQAPRSALSRERLWVLRGDAGLGGLLRLELLEAVECRGESESSPS